MGLLNETFLKEESPTNFVKRALHCLKLLSLNEVCSLALPKFEKFIYNHV